MKAVVVELRGLQAAVLQSDGCVRLVKNEQYAVGQALELREGKKPLDRLAMRLAWAAAVAAVTIIPACAYFMPYSYVSLDVNPSIEYSLNRFDRVLRCTALNDDGAEILTDLALRNRGIGEAVKLTVGALAREGYLNSEAPAELVITASSGSEAKSGKLAAELAQAAEAAAEAAAVEVQVDSEGVGRQRVEQAQELGLTPGKLNLIDKLQESAAEPEDIQVEDWADKSVGEIISQTKKNENASKNSNENASSGKETVPGQVKKTDGAETESENQSGSEASGEAHENNQNSSANSKESHGNPASQDNSSEDTED